MEEVSALVASCQSYAEAVGALTGRLEDELRRAQAQCWELRERPLALKGNVFRAKTVVVQEAVFQSEVEQQQLGGALDQWQRTAEGAAAAAAVLVRATEWRLLQAVSREVEQQQAEPLGKLLGGLLSAHETIAAMQLEGLSPVLDGVEQLAADVSAAWRAAAGSADATELVTGHASLPDGVLEALSGALGQEPPAAALQSRQRRQHQKEALEEAAALLRYWGRRGEKRQAGEEGVRPAGREGDVPKMLAEAQSRLWAWSQAWEEEVGAVNVATRQLACTRFSPTDASLIAASAEAYEDGQRVPLQELANYNERWATLRQRAAALLVQPMADKGVTAAAESLHQLEHVLLHAELPADYAQARQQVVARLAEALLDGSTPLVATPYLTSLFERALGSGVVQMAQEDKLAMVPRIGQAMREGGRSALREREAVALLRAALDPDALLNTQQLCSFYSALQGVLDVCQALSADAAASLLASFDGARFAVLACEEASESASEEGAREPGVSTQQLLALVHSCLGLPGAEALASQLVEGLLSLHPARFFAGCLQLAIASGLSMARADTLRMLCRVPPEMLPPPVLADALSQVAEGIDSDHLAPPFLPYELMGLLQNGPDVLASLHSSMPDGTFAAPEEHSAHGELWTVRVGGALQSLPAELSPAGGEGSSGAGQARPPIAHAASSPVMLLPVPASHLPLGQLSEQLTGAVLSTLLRRLGASLDAEGLCEELAQVAQLLLGPLAQQGAWGLEYAWRRLYRHSLQPFLAAAATGGASGAGPVFQQFWVSLPWQQATFLAASPSRLAELRAYLLGAPDGAALELLSALDFSSVLTKAVPAEPASAEMGLFTLVEEESGLVQEDAPGQPLWAAELGLLALHACVLLPAERQPSWLRKLLEGAPATQPQQQQQEGEVEDTRSLMQPAAGPLEQLASRAGGQPLLPHLLAAADWDHVHAAVAAHEAAAPWLLLPALMAASTIVGDVGARLVQAGTLLSQGALQTGAAAAAETAAAAVRPLLLCSVCQGQLEEEMQQEGGQQQQEWAVAAAPEVERVQIPADIPLELLQDTVEYQQLQLLEQQQQLQEEAQAQQRARAGPAAGAAPGEQLPLVAVQACWSLSREEHLALMQECLLPLALQFASAQLAAGLQPAQCPPFGRPGGIHTWTPLQLPELLDAVAAAPVDAAHASASSTAATASTNRNSLQVVAALLAASLQQPVTILTAEPLPFGNCEVPLDTTSALYLSSSGGGAGEGPGGSSSGWQGGRLRQKLGSLVPGSEARRRAAEAAASSQQDSSALAIADLLQGSLLDACLEVGSAPLLSCILRMLGACEALHSSREALGLLEALVCSLVGEPAGSSSEAGREGGAFLERASSNASSSSAVTPTVTASPTPPSAAHLGQQQAPQAGPAAAQQQQQQDEQQRSAAKSLQPAVAAAEGLPSSTLLSLARGCAMHLAPLAAAFALERLRLCTSVAPKAEWQELVVQVLQTVLLAEAPASRPYDLVAVWLAGIAWVADSRWRRLAPERAHAEALGGWLEALDLRVVALKVASPEDFEAARGNSPAKVLGAAAERLKRLQLRETIPGLQRLIPQPLPPSQEGGTPLPLAPPQPPQEYEWGVMHPGTAPPEDARLGQRIQGGLSKGIRGVKSILSRGGGKEEGPAAGSTGPWGGAGEEGGGGKKQGALSGIRTRLSKLGRGQEAGGAPAAGGGEGALLLRESPVGDLMGQAAAGEAGSSADSEAAVAAAQQQQGQPGGGGAVKATSQKLSSGVRGAATAVGRQLRSVSTRLAHGGRQGGGAAPEQAAAGQDREALVRVGLAAFAVAAYLRSVLAPNLLPRFRSGLTVSSGGTPLDSPSTPTLATRAAVLGSSSHHRTTSSIGRSLDEAIMQELDTVLEARSEMDKVESLATCPLVQADPAPYQRFFSSLQLLLSAATPPDAFQRQLLRLLFGGSPALAAVLRL